MTDFIVRKKIVSILWLRHGLRLHDNPALLEAISSSDEFYPIFIFDGESAGTKLIGYNRMQFLLESLNDLDSQLRAVGGRLFVFKGAPEKIFTRLWEEKSVSKICFEKDCEPLWHARDLKVKTICAERNISCREFVSHTLWDPQLVIDTNGGSPPLTYQMFMHTVSLLGEPPRPVKDVDWSTVKFGQLHETLVAELQMFSEIPTSAEYFSLSPPSGHRIVRWYGGETRALKLLDKRLVAEERAFREGVILTNQAKPDLLGAPTSQSAALRLGCISVRRSYPTIQNNKFYWSLHDLFNAVFHGHPPAGKNITGQLVWREYFYTMSVNNPYYAEMSRNPICLDIPWDTNKELFDKWKNGKTGYPFIDAAMRQLNQEGWIHHVARNAAACFLTRGDLWLNWEDGMDYFMEKLLDADWSVNAGNWMWVSSSAFEQLLDCSECICPVKYGRRLDPWGEYIRRYVPELFKLPSDYIYEPWKMPLELQQEVSCIIGRDYPERIVDHKMASQRNRRYMQQIRDKLMGTQPAHCCPSSEEETRQFMWLPDECADHVCK